MDINKMIERGTFWGMIALVVVFLTAALITPKVSFAFPTLFAVWFFVGIFTVAANEQVVKIIGGRPYAYAASGFRWILWLPFGLSEVLRYTRVPVELEFSKSAGILTKKGPYLGYTEDFESISVVAKGVSFFFEWPEGDDLITSATKLGAPTKTDLLANLFQEAILDEVRSVGSQRVYIELWQNRTKFAKDTADSLVDPSNRTTAANLVRDAGLQNP